MAVGQLQVEYRGQTGKGVARRLRAQGKIPGICYGRQAESIPIALDPTALLKCLDPEKKRNTVITMQVAGKKDVGDLLVMLRDFQLDPLTNQLEHADFVQIKMDQEIRVTVPIELIGKPEGVKIGGLLNVVYRHLEVAARPNAIPNKVTVNIEKLEIGDAVHVRDLKLGEGVRALVDPGAAIASVVAPKAEKEEAPAAEAVAAEGAAAAVPGAPGAAAPGAPGAAPGAPGAAPGAPGAAPAAAAPAGKGAEKKEGKK
jgi:large subunit ribosomal protein L25